MEPQFKIGDTVVLREHSEDDPSYFGTVIDLLDEDYFVEWRDKTWD